MDPEWKNLIEKLKASGVLQKPEIIAAFSTIDRKNFVPDGMKGLAYADEPLPIPGRQTISQPYTVAFMLGLLDPKPGDKILDIGAGSGWQTALLARVVGDSGKVYALEIIDDLCKFGMDNLKKYDFFEKKTVHFFCGNASAGFLEGAPYNGIIAGAALRDNVPESWFKQLLPGGKIVAPIKNSVWVYFKKDDGKMVSKEYTGFAFVPFKED